MKFTNFLLSFYYDQKKGVFSLLYKGSDLYNLSERKHMNYQLTKRLIQVFHEHEAALIQTAHLF